MVMAMVSSSLYRTILSVNIDFPKRHIVGLIGGI